MSRPANRAKTHFLKNVDLSSILEPAAPGEAAITATKGNLAAHDQFSLGVWGRSKTACVSSFAYANV